MQTDEEYRQWIGEKLGQHCAANLKKHGFDAHVVPDIAAGKKLILEMVMSYETFGFGGSTTTRALGLTQALRENGKTVYDHWQPGLTKAADLELRQLQGRCDCFFSSANAIAATGEIVNVDGAGNRVNATIFGPKKVVIVAGINKVTPDIDSALARIRNVAAPMRAKSLNMQTPCAETGICTDCNSPQRICRVTVILHRKPMLIDISVIIINQSLGF